MLGFVDKGITAMVYVVAVASAILVVGLMGFTVLARYVLELSVVGIHELMLIFAVQLYMAGSVIAARNRSQLSVDWLTQSLKTDDARRLHELVLSTATLCVTLFFILWAYKMMHWGFKRPQTTPALQIPLWISQISILIAALCCAGYAARDLVVAAKMKGSKK